MTTPAGRQGVPFSAVAGGKTGVKTGKAPQARRTPQAKPDSRTPREKRVDGILGYAQVIAGVLFQAPPLRPDAAAIAYYAGPIANEAADIAENDERAARLLDKIAETGPYGALVMALGSLALQVAANHKLVSPGTFGTFPPDEIVKLVTEEEGDGKP